MQKNKTIVFVSPSAPNSNGKGYEKLLYDRLSLSPPKYDLVVLVIQLPFSKKVPRSGDKTFRVEYFEPSFSDLIRALFKVLAGYPIQVALFSNKAAADYIQHLTSNGDTVVAITSRMGINLPEHGFSIDFVDSLSMNFERRAFLKNNLIWKASHLFESSRLKSFEAKLNNRAVKSFVVSKIDAEFIGDHVNVLPLGVQIPDEMPNGRRQGIVFSGNLGYEPNVSAISWFLKNVWHLILAECPEACLSIVGRGLSSRNATIYSTYKGVNVIGEVEDMYSELEKYRVAIAPMISGSGMQFKILEAMAVGTPVVTTKTGLGDLCARNLEQILIEDNAREFAHSVVSLYQNLERANKIAKSAFDYVKREHQDSTVVSTFFASIK